MRVFGIATLVLLLLMTTSCRVGSTVTESVTAPIGSGISEGLARPLGCVLGATFANFSPSMNLEISSLNWSRVSEQAVTQNVTTPTDFWAKLEQPWTENLKKWIEEGYSKLPANSHLRKKPLPFYLDLLATGVIYFKNSSPNANRYVIIRTVSAVENKTRVFTHYSISIKTNAQSFTGQDTVVGHHICE